MTHLQESELREKAGRIFDDKVMEVDVDGVHYVVVPLYGAVQRSIELATSYASTLAQEAERKGRIDELEHLVDHSSDTTWHDYWYSVADRLATLTPQDTEERG